MKKIKISYNPYYISTKILVDGEKPSLNSDLNFSDEGLRLTEWANLFPQILLKECSDSNYEIDFIGSIDDFNELQEAFVKHSNVIDARLHHSRIIPSIDRVEKKVYDIYEEIKSGPVVELKDKSIETAFQNAQSRKLEIGIVAAMSSGKSTLINALLGKKLMPVANKATTSTIVRIAHREQKNFHAVTFDENHNVINEYNDISYEQMKGLNNDEQVLEIFIEGPIPCVSSVGMELVLIDTPGPNNSRNIRHKIITRNLLKDSDRNPSLVLFIQNAQNPNTTDESGILDFVSKSMSEGNKHSRDRYIFAVNKMDELKPEDDSVEGTLREAYDVLEEKGISRPNLFPVSAQVAFENRSNVPNAKDCQWFRDRCKTDESMHFEKYYDFSHLPLNVKKELEEKLSIADEATTIDIHSGIVSIEEAIRLYVNKYARTIKIRDLVESFNRNLQTLATLAKIQKEIEKNEKKRKELEKQIEELNQNIRSGKEALKFSQKLKKWDFTSQAESKIKKRFNDATSEISNLEIQGIGDKMSKSSAAEKCSILDHQISEIIANLISDIESIIEKSFQDSLHSIKKDFVTYLNKLNAGIDSTLFSVEEFDLQFDDIFDVNKILNDNTRPVDEEYDDNVTKTKTIEGNRASTTRWMGIIGMKAGSFIAPGLGTAVGAAVGAALGYLCGEGDRKVAYTEIVKKTRTVEYVNMTSVVKKCKAQTSEEIENARKETLLYLEEQSGKLKSNIENKVEKVNDAIEKKAVFLSNLASQSKNTSILIKSQKENRNWLLKMQEKVNDLIDF